MLFGHGHNGMLMQKQEWEREEIRTDLAAAVAITPAAPPMTTTATWPSIRPRRICVSNLMIARESTALALDVAGGRRRAIPRNLPTPFPNRAGVPQVCVGGDLLTESGLLRNPALRRS